MSQDKRQERYLRQAAQQLHEHHEGRRRYMRKVATVMGTAGFGMGGLGSAAAHDKERQKTKKKNPDEACPNGEPIEIDACTTITEPGEYVLTQNIQAPPQEVCIDIQASDVTLDGNGYTLTGSQQMGIGILAQNVSNVIIQDITVTNFQQGVGFGEVENSSLLRVVATENAEQGIILIDSNENQILESTVSSTTGTISDGISLSGNFPGSSNNRISRTTVTDNEFTGIAVQFGSNDNILEENLVDGNGSDGISIFSSSVRNIIRQNVITNNGNDGVSSTNSTHETTILSNTVSGNANTGINLSDSSDSIISTNEVNQNDEYGIMIGASSNDVMNVEVVNNEISNNDVGIFFSTFIRELTENTITDNIATENRYGLFLNGTNATTATNNELSDNIIAGVQLTSSENNTLSNNNTSNNEETGIVLQFSDMNTIDDNTSDENGQYGITLTNSNENTVTNNSLQNNGIAPCLVVGSTGNTFENNDPPCDDEETGVVSGPLSPDSASRSPETDLFSSNF